MPHSPDGPSASDASDGDLPALLADQVAYYDARAAEYDLDMWQWGTSDPEIAEHHESALDWFARLPVRGDVLEIACGTGAWTGRLAARATHVTAVDAAPAMLREARAKHGHLANITFALADVLAWQQPPGPNDLVFLSFFASHVPAAAADRFWHDLVATLAPGGTIAVLDATASRTDEEDWVAPGVARRRLRDGTAHRVVKVFDHTSELTARLAQLGLHATTEQLSDRLWSATFRHRPSR